MSDIISDSYICKDETLNIYISRTTVIMIIVKEIATYILKFKDIDCRTCIINNLIHIEINCKNCWICTLITFWERCFFYKSIRCTVIAVVHFETIRIQWNTTIACLEYFISLQHNYKLYISYIILKQLTQLVHTQCLFIVNIVMKTNSYCKPHPYNKKRSVMHTNG